MNDKEIAEIRRRLRPEKNNISRLRGCYVNDKHSIISEFDQNFGLISSDESEEILSLIRRTLTGSIGRNLINISFTNDQVLNGEEYSLLIKLRDSSLSDSDSVRAFFEKVVASLDIDGSYFILLANDKYGKGLRESVKDMGRRSGAILAITGDTYGNQDAGIVIRNGIVHRKEKSTFDVCVLYYDGTMRTFAPEAFSLEQAIAQGAYQAWTFGPMLLDEQGMPIPDAKLNTSKNIRRANPRAGIGYYEPGHYCFVVVDGRTDDASGLTLEQFAQLFADLGCKAAYNMDGGRSAELYYDGKILNDPYKGGRSVSDCLIIREIS